jgi:hypothetical protein
MLIVKNVTFYLMMQHDVAQHLETGLEKTRVILKKPSPLGFFVFVLFFLGFLGFFWGFLGFFAQTRGFLGFFNFHV